MSAAGGLPGARRASRDCVSEDCCGLQGAESFNAMQRRVPALTNRDIPNRSHASLNSVTSEVGGTRSSGVCKKVMNAGKFGCQMGAEVYHILQKRAPITNPALCSVLRALNRNRFCQSSLSNGAGTSLENASSDCCSSARSEEPCPILIDSIAVFLVRKSINKGGWLEC